MNAAVGFRQPCLIILRDTLQAVLLEAEELLFTLTRQAQDHQALDLHLDTLRYLRNLRQHALPDMLRQLEAPEAHQPPPLNPVLEQALERLALHIEASHINLIAALEGKLEALGLDPKLALYGFRPRDISTAIAQQLAAQPADLASQLFVLRLLDQLLVPALGTVYQHLHQQLESCSAANHGQGLPPCIDPQATGILDREALLAHFERLQQRLCQQTLPTNIELPQLRRVPELPADTLLTPDMQYTLDLMGLMIYDALTDPTVSEELKPLLLRMHLPLLKATVLDPTIVRNPQHPVRQLWTRLVLLARQAKAAQAPWRTRVERLIQDLCLNLGQDLALFARTLEKLRSIEYLPRDFTPAMQRQREHTCSCLSFNEARSLATDTIHAVLAEYDDQIPTWLRTFLLQTWGPLLLIIAQHQGHASQDWMEAVGLMRRLLRLACYQEAEDENPQRLLEAMHACMKQHGLEQPAFQKALKELFQQLEANSRPAPSASAPASSTPIPAASSPESIPLKLPLRVIEAFLRQAFRPGDWYLIHSPLDPIPRRLKAYHADLALGVVVFADRLERPVLELPLQQFIQDILANRTHPVFPDDRHELALSQLKTEAMKA